MARINRDGSPFAASKTFDNLIQHISCIGSPIVRIQKEKIHPPNINISSNIKGETLTTIWDAVSAIEQCVTTTIFLDGYT